MTAFSLKIIALASMIVDHLVKSGIVPQSLFVEKLHMSIKSSFALLETLLFIGRLANLCVSYRGRLQKNAEHAQLYLQTAGIWIVVRNSV